MGNTLNLSNASAITLLICLLKFVAVANTGLAWYWTNFEIFEFSLGYILFISRSRNSSSFPSCKYALSFASNLWVLCPFHIVC